MAVSRKSAHEADAPRDDAELLARLRAGDETAFAWLLRTYHGALLRLALNFVSSRAVAEEVVQETWLGVMNGVATFEGRSSFKTWLFRILTNQAKQRGVREHRSVPFSSFETAGEEHPAAVDPSRFRSDGMWAQPPHAWDDATPERLVSNQQALQHLQAAIAALPANQRAVVTLRDIEGLDGAEVCSILDISDTNQRVLLHRARSNLRAALEEFVEGK